jgi:hypothetical protein
MNWKNYLVAVLLCSMILALAFIHNSGSQTTFQYDPWADINDDGIIDIFDLVNLANKYGTTGDPTKNVNVTNWPNVLNVNVTNGYIRILHSTEEWNTKLTINPGDSTWYIHTVKGYRQITKVWSI